jgi:hypothetical protein
VPRSAEGDTDLPARAVLVGLGPTQMNDDPLTDRLDVLNIQAGQLGSSKSSGKSDEQERLIAGILEVAAYRIKDDEQIVSQQRLSLLLRAATASLYAAQDRLDEF